MANEHYKQTEMDPLTAYEQGLLSAAEYRGFIKGNIIKYIYRYEHKGGLNDLLKARDYIGKLIILEQENL